MLRSEVIARVNAMSLEDLPLSITYARGQFTVTSEDYDNHHYVHGSSVRISDITDGDITNRNDHGLYAGTFAGFDIYEYHASYTSPYASNYAAELDDLEMGDASRVVIACEPLEDSWVLAVRSEDTAGAEITTTRDL